MQSRTTIYAIAHYTKMSVTEKKINEIKVFRPRMRKKKVNDKIFLKQAFIIMSYAQSLISTYQEYFSTEKPVAIATI